MAKKKRPSIDNYLTIPQAIEHFQIKKATFYYWLKIGFFPSDMMGDTKIVLKSDVKEFIDDNY